MEPQVILGTIAGAVISVLFNVVPGLNAAYDKLDKKRKQLVMVGALALAAGGWFGASCLGFDVGMACTVADVRAVIVTFVFAVIGNFGTYGGTKYLFGKKVEKQAADTEMVINVSDSDPKLAAAVREEVERVFREANQTLRNRTKRE